MIQYCPYCGHQLKKPFECGISSCHNCRRVFDSSPFHRLLSAAWFVRKEHLYLTDRLVQHGFSQEEADLVVECIYNKDYSHEDFLCHLNDLKVSKLFTVEIKS